MAYKPPSTTTNPPTPPSGAGYSPTPKTVPPPATGLDPQFSLSASTPTIQMPAMEESKVPFGALNVDANGNAYYGEGLVGWVRKTYADLFDPKKRFANLDMSQSDWDAVNQFRDTAAKELAQKWTGEDNQLLGLSTEEVAQAITSVTAPAQVAEKNDKSVAGTVITNTASMTRDLFQRSAWGALEILGLGDVGARKVMSAGIALEDVAKQVKPEGSVLPEIFGHRNAIENAAIVANALARGDIEWEGVKGELTTHMKASQMAYTMIFNEQKRKEFERQIANGEDPGILAQSLADPLTELAGSVFFDPTTYFGMGIPTLARYSKGQELLESAKFLGVKLPWRIAGRLPEFGDVLSGVGLNVGKNRVFGKVTQRYFTAATKEISDILERGVNTVNDADLLRVIDEGIPKAARQMHDRFLIGDAPEIVARRKAAWASQFTVTSLRSTDKAKVLAKDVSTVAENLLPKLGAEGTINALRDMRLLASPSASEIDRVAAIKRLMTLSVSTPEFKAMAFSPAAYEAGAALSYMNEATMDNLIRKFGNNPQELGKALFARAEEMANDIIPSVNDMANAKKNIKNIRLGGTPEQIEKAEFLADQYDNLPNYVKLTNSVAAKVDKIHRPLTGAQVMTYLAASPGYAVRNVTGFIGMATPDLGLETAVKIVATTAANATAASSSAHLAQRADDLVKLGKGAYAPPEIWKGIGAVGEETKAIGALGLAQNTEKVMGAEIIYDTAIKEIRKAAPAVARKAMTNLEKSGVITKQQADLFMGLLDQLNYNESAAFTELRRIVGGGINEDWKTIPIPTKLRAEMERIPGANEAILKAQQESQTAEEFLQRTDEILNKLTDWATDKARYDQPAIGENVKHYSEETVQSYVEMGDIAQKEKDALLEQLVYDMGFRIDAYANTRTAFDKAERVLFEMASQMAVNPELKPVFEELKSAVNSSREVFGRLKPFHNNLRNAANILSDQSHNSDDVAMLWNKAKIGFDPKTGVPAFDLSEFFPNVVPANLSPAEFRSYLWQGYSQWTELMWRSGNENYFPPVVDAYTNFFKTAGTSLQDVISTNGGNVKTLFGEYEKAAGIAKTWENQGIVPPTVRRMLRNLPPDAKLSQVEWDTFQKSFGFNMKRVFNQVNQDRRTAGLAEAATMDDVPFAEAVKAAMKRADPPKVPPPYNGGNPSHARSWYESLPALSEDFKGYQQAVAQNFNKVTPLDNFTDEAEKVFNEFAQTFGEQMSLIRSKSVAWGVARRDFLLFDYNKTYLDLAHAYLKPFGYWTNRAYAASAELMLSNPAWASRYLAYKQYNAREHSELPAWWRESVGLNLPGTDDNSVFVNLEANINPIYSLTGVDFNDPRKRVDWLSTFVDDMNKTNGAVSTPINWAVALWLQSKGEEDAARRWRGRLLPQTRAIKALANADIGGTNFLEMIGADDSQVQAFRYGEIDPFIAAFDNGVDAYEEGRVANALAQWIEEGTSDEDKAERAARATDAVYQRSGDLYDYAVERATDKTAPGAVMSFFGGPGFKVRTQADADLDNFYNQYYKLVQSRDLMDSDEYRAAWDKMRTDWPMMDALIIGKKDSEDRDAAFAYNVLGRVPPGDLTKVFEMMGIDQARVDSFYSNKGDMSSWGQGEAGHFMNGVLMLSAVLKMPSSADRTEWTNAKTAYKAVETQVEAQLGDGIWDRVQEYYDALETDPQAAEALKEMFPIQQALDMKRAYIANSPQLYKYYGSLDTLEAYYQSKMRGEMTKRFGENIYDLSADYSVLSERAKLELPGAKEEFESFKKQNYAKLKNFWNAKDEWQEWVNRSVAEIGAKMPESPEIQVRPGETPTQQYISEQLNAPQGVTAEEILSSKNMRPEIVELIRDFFATGESIPQVAERRIQFAAEEFGLSPAELLQILGVYFSQQ